MTLILLKTKHFYENILAEKFSPQFTFYETIPIVNKDSNNNCIIKYLTATCETCGF